MKIKVNKAARKIVNAMSAEKRSGTSPYDTQGEVRRVEGHTAYVRFTGGKKETPVRMTISCKPGDIVQIRVANKTAWITGNVSAPPTDDTSARSAMAAAGKAMEAAQKAQGDTDKINEAIDRGELTVAYVETQYILSESNTEYIPSGEWSTELPDPAPGYYYWKRTATYYVDGSVSYSEPLFDQSNQLAAETAAALASTNNHFWSDGSGAYVTEEEGDWSNGYATRVTSSGILQSYMGDLLTAWTNSGVSFFQSDGNTPMAEYGSAQLNLYAAGILAMALASGSITFYDADGQTPLAYIGESASQNLFGLISDVVESKKYNVIGNFMWIANSDGSLTLKKVGA